MKEDKSTGPNCMACLYFYITYETSHPYGCRAMDFKSKGMPSHIVFANSGMQCHAFKSKKQKV